MLCCKVEKETFLPADSGRASDPVIPPEHSHQASTTHKPHTYAHFQYNFFFSRSVWKIFRTPADNYSGFLWDKLSCRLPLHTGVNIQKQHLPIDLYLSVVLSGCGIYVID